MGLIQKLFGQPVKPAPARKIQTVKAPGARTFAAGEIDRLTASFTGSHLSINEELRRSLVRMRQRSRELCANNDYARKFLKLVKANVIGPRGITLQCQFTNERGELDLRDNDLVESVFKDWSKRQHCSASTRLSWVDIQNLVIETVARDGEALLMKVRDKKRPHVLSLRPMECDHLDVNHNEELSGGRRIVMGVEIDRHEKPVAYWLTTRHPGDSAQNTYYKRDRIPAEDIIHIFITERAGQVRGVPWMHSAILRLNMLGKYEEAELVAARVGASKMGFYTSATGDDMTPTEMAGNGREYDDYDLTMSAEPGQFEQLPDGVGFTTFDPQHPTAAFADFTKAVLRGASSGLTVSYNSLANDLEGVNFSSIRSGVLEEREQWRTLQNWLIDQLHGEIYADWLESGILGGQLKMLPYSKIDSKFSKVTWQPRGWQWVDPLKDVKANAEEFQLGTISLTEIAASKGKDLNDIFKQTRADLDLAKSYGLSVGVVNNQLILSEAESDGNS